MFSVTVREADVKGLEETLARISPATIAKLHSNLMSVQPIFRYTAWGEVEYGNDGIPLLAFELWLKKEGKWPNHEFDSVH